MKAGSEPDRKTRGLRIRREVLGDEHVDAAVRATTEFTAPFQDFITRTAWGDVWARPGLDRRMRSAITLAILTALRAEGEIAMHVRAALGNGLTPEEISEVLLHAAVYAGVPAANSAFAIAAPIVAQHAPTKGDDTGSTKSGDSAPAGAMRASARLRAGRPATGRSETGRPTGRSGSGPEGPRKATDQGPRKGMARRRRST